VSRWRFSPALLRGNAVASDYFGTLRFDLNLPGQGILSASSKDAWRAVREMLRQLKVPVEKVDDANQTVTSGRVRYVALPLPPPASLGLPPGFQPERLILHIYVTPGMEPARVSVGSVLQVEPIASNDARHLTAYGLNAIGGWFLEELARRMGARMAVMSASAERRAAQARELMPPGLTDPCATTPAQLLDPQTTTPAQVSLPRKIYGLQPNYPKDQIEANKTAQIKFHGEITEHGTLINPTMTEPANAPASFVAAAQLAFGQWRFAPSQVQGCPARTNGTFTSTFNLK
jgi:hypothetical protein